MEVEALADSFEFPQIFIRGRAMRAPTGLYGIPKFCKKSDSVVGTKESLPLEWEKAEV